MRMETAAPYRKEQTSTSEARSMEKTPTDQELHHEIFGSILDRTEMTPFLLLPARDYATSLMQAAKMMTNRGFDAQGGGELPGGGRARLEVAHTGARCSFVGRPPRPDFRAPRLEAASCLRAASVILRASTYGVCRRGHQQLEAAGAVPFMRQEGSLSEQTCRMDAARRPVPLCDLLTQYAGLRPAIEEAVCRVLASGQAILGPEVEALEREVAEYCGVPHAVGCGSGTDALLLALQGLGVGPGDEVILPPFTFFASVGSVVRLGARPVFADVVGADGDLNLDVASVEDAITDRTVAVMPVHFGGYPVEIERLVAVCEDRGLTVIEDAAQAAWTEVDGRAAGSFGLAGCFSFFPTKNLGAAGDGGFDVGLGEPADEYRRRTAPFASAASPISPRVSRSHRGASASASRARRSPTVATRTPSRRSSTRRR